MAVATEVRRAAVERLATRAWSRLVAVARAEAGPELAEDAVQDVLLRLAAGAGDLPLDDARATAYATTAVRRAARAGAVRRGAVVEAADRRAAADEPEDRLETRRRLVAFARALDAVPAGLRQTVALDAAGYGRADIAAAVGRSERAVKRALEEHRAPVLAATLASLDGTDCERFADTLAAYGAGAGLPRRGGPVAAHLEICDACRAGLRRAAAVRRTLRAALGVPLAPAAALGTAGAGASLTALVGALKLPLAIVAAGAAMTAGGLGALHAVGGGRPPVERVAPAPAPLPASAPAARPAAPGVPTATTATTPGPAVPRPTVRPTLTPATRATREPVARAVAPPAPTAAPPVIREGTAQRARPARTTAPVRPAPTEPVPVTPTRAAPAPAPDPAPASAPAAAPCAQQGLCAP